MSKIRITAHTAVRFWGWRVYRFTVENAGLTEVSADDFTIAGNCHHPMLKKPHAGITGVTLEDGVLTVDVEPMAFKTGWAITGPVDITPDAINDVKIDWVDRFSFEEDNGVLYRLYTPKAAGPRPLILFLHGGGEQGFDNTAQMTGTIGAGFLAEKFPDMYVMAPQCPGNFSAVMMRQKPPKPYGVPFADSDNGSGWTRDVLGRVCDLIRGLIAEGKVLADRVYVTGMSMGGAGTIRAMSVGSDIFAAGAPICPSMMPDTYNILRHMDHGKVWVSTAYVDHTIYRHKYITDAIMELRDKGNRDAHLTIYSPEELEKYDIGTDPDTPYPMLFGLNHGSWELTLNDEHGIMSWLTSQTKA